MRDQKGLETEDKDPARHIKYSDVGKDLIVIYVRVPRYPMIKPEVNQDTGEIDFTVTYDKRATKKLKKTNRIPYVDDHATLPVILNQDGVPLLLENLYLRYRMNRVKEETLKHEAAAMLAFCRYVYSSEWENDVGEVEQMTFRSLTKNPKYGAPYLFMADLVENLRVLDPSSGIILEEGWAASTAKSYVSCVIRFYRWLIESRYLKVTNEYTPFHSKDIQISFTNNGSLGHASKGIKISVETTDIMQEFNTGKTRTVPAWEQLKPMTPLHRVMFENQLNKSLGSAKSLMYELCLEAGLRMQEVCTFPESVIRQPRSGESIIKVSISKQLNGCETKFSKQRTIEISAKLMKKLWDYKASEARLSRLGTVYRLDVPTDESPRGKKTFDQIEVLDTYKEFELEPHCRLFISEKSHDPVAKNTLQHYLGDIRQHLIDNYARESEIALNKKQDEADAVYDFHDLEERQRPKQVPKWYYRPHDTRSTFATRWLIREHIKRQVPLEMLLDELALLMGHENTEQTRKYVKFMDAKLLRFKSASRRNMNASMMY
ncbi:hypothetical protein AB4560_09695 [Vibrio sp. 10N.222.51.C12]|uniref:hypothetical protein n=1 Tax=Vibrio sp. 10N.222.51.C12 TaxID=3229622 RepID=UPI0035524806